MFLCLLFADGREMILELRSCDRDHAASSLFKRQSAKLGDAEFGHDRVDVCARTGNRGHEWNNPAGGAVAGRRG